MKNTIRFITFRTLLAALTVSLFAGCAATRPISDVALGAGGAYAGYELPTGVLLPPPLARQAACS